MHEKPVRSRLLDALALIAALALAPHVAGADVPDVGDEDAPAEFSSEFLSDGNVIRQGKKVWGRTCKLCHGNTAYPGKAPKLGKKCYEADFVYDRVTNGFQAMPAWKSQIEKFDRMSVAAFIVSRRFPSDCVR